MSRSAALDDRHGRVVVLGPGLVAIRGRNVAEQVKRRARIRAIEVAAGVEVGLRDHVARAEGPGLVGVEIAVVVEVADVEATSRTAVTSDRAYPSPSKPVSVTLPVLSTVIAVADHVAGRSRPQPPVVPPATLDTSLTMFSPGLAPPERSHRPCPDRSRCCRRSQRCGAGQTPCPHRAVEVAAGVNLGLRHRVRRREAPDLADIEYCRRRRPRRRRCSIDRAQSATAISVSVTVMPVSVTLPVFCDRDRVVDHVAGRSPTTDRWCRRSRSTHLDDGQLRVDIEFSRCGFERPAIVAGRRRQKSRARPGCRTDLARRTISSCLGRSVAVEIRLGEGISKDVGRGPFGERPSLARLQDIVAIVTGPHDSSRRYRRIQINLIQTEQRFGELPGQ